jgi:GNAT superfamily N-acetyltransferase
MTPPPFRVLRLTPEVERADFESGSAALDRYFREQVMQDMRRRVTSAFIAMDDDNRVVGFYTLSASSIPLTALPAATTRKMPRYPSVPCVRMGRLAVARRHQGSGLGAALLSDALVRAASADIAAYALIVDAKDAKAAAFYEHQGFMAFSDQPLVSFLPLETVSKISPR